MNYNKFKIFEFKLEKMVPNPAIVMIAKRGSGKSFITRDIIYHYRHIPGGIVISPTDRLDSFYKYFFPDLFIHYDIKDITFKKILVRQSMMLEKMKEKKRHGKKVDPRSILVMDDCLAKKKTWAKDESIMEILMNGRHYYLTYLLTMQYIMGISPELRGNFDYIFLLKEDSSLTKKKLWDNYAGMFETLAVFDKVFTTCTKDHRSMVIDNRKPADNIQEKVYWFKAKKRKFSFGSRKFIEMHKKYYDPLFMRKKNVAMLDVVRPFGKKRNEPEIDIKIEKI